MRPVTIGQIEKATGGRIALGNKDALVTGVSTDSREASAILRRPLRVAGRTGRLLRCAPTAVRGEEARPADARLAGFCAAFVALRVPWAVR